MKTKISIFVSSTFKGMEKERQRLVTSVFYQLRERLKKIGSSLFETELRWGIPNFEDDGMETNKWHYLKKNIDATEDYVIVFLGTYYGTVQPAQQFQKEDFSDDPDFLNVAINKSFTDIEIRYATKNFTSFKKQKLLFYERKQIKELKEIDLSSGNSDYQDNTKQKLDTLKNDCRKYAKKHALTYRSYSDVDNDWEKLLVEDLWTAIVIDHLMLNIKNKAMLKPYYTYGGRRHFTFTEQQWNKIVSIYKTENKPSESDSFGHDDELKHFIFERTALFVERTEELNQLNAFTDSNFSGICTIVGNPGIGKTSLICRFQKDLEQKGINNIIYYPGLVDMPNIKEVVINKLLDGLNKLGISVALQTNREMALATLLQNNDFFEQKKIIIIIDAIEQIQDGQDLLWLPENLPGQLKFIFTTNGTSQITIDAFRRFKVPVRSIVLNGLEDCGKILIPNFLQLFGKKLPQNVVHLLAQQPQSGNPLYIKVLLRELLTEKSTEKYMLGDEAFIQEKLNQYPNTESLFTWVLEKMEEQVEKEKCRLWFGYLYVSRRGLEENELSDLLANQYNEMVQYETYKIKSYMSPYLQYRGTYIDFYHDQLKLAVEERYMNDDFQQKCHSDIVKYFVIDDKWMRNTHALQELPYHLYKAGLKEQLYNLSRNDYFLDLQKTVSFDNNSEALLQSLKAAYGDGPRNWDIKELSEFIFAPLLLSQGNVYQSPLEILRAENKGLSEALNEADQFTTDERLQWYILLALESKMLGNENNLQRILERLANSANKVIAPRIFEWNTSRLSNATLTEKHNVNCWIAIALAELSKNHEEIIFKIQSIIFSDGLKYELCKLLIEKKNYELATKVGDQITDHYFEVEKAIFYYDSFSGESQDKYLLSIEKGIHHFFASCALIERIGCIAACYYRNGNFIDGERINQQFFISKFEAQKSNLKHGGLFVRVHLNILLNKLKGLIWSNSSKTFIVDCVAEIISHREAIVYFEIFKFDTFDQEIVKTKTFWEETSLKAIQLLIPFDSNLILKFENYTQKNSVKWIIYSNLIDNEIEKSAEGRDKTIKRLLLETLAKTDRKEMALGLAGLAKYEPDFNRCCGLLETASLMLSSYSCDEEEGLFLKLQLAEQMAEAQMYNYALKIAYQIRHLEFRCQNNRNDGNTLETEQMMLGHYQLLLKKIASISSWKKDKYYRRKAIAYLYPIEKQEIVISQCLLDLFETSGNKSDFRASKFIDVASELLLYRKANSIKQEKYDRIREHRPSYNQIKNVDLKTLKQFKVYVDWIATTMFESENYIPASLNTQLIRYTLFSKEERPMIFFFSFLFVSFLLMGIFSATILPIFIGIMYIPLGFKMLISLIKKSGLAKFSDYILKDINKKVKIKLYGEQILRHRDFLNDDLDDASFLRLKELAPPINTYDHVYQSTTADDSNINYKLSNRRMQMADVYLDYGFIKTAELCVMSVERQNIGPIADDIDRTRRFYNSFEVRPQKLYNEKRLDAVIFHLVESLANVRRIDDAFRYIDKLSNYQIKENACLNIIYIRSFTDSIIKIEELISQSTRYVFQSSNKVINQIHSNSDGQNINFKINLFENLLIRLIKNGYTDNAKKLAIESQNNYLLNFTIEESEKYFKQKEHYEISQTLELQQNQIFETEIDKINYLWVQMKKLLSFNKIIEASQIAQQNNNPEINAIFHFYILYIAYASKIQENVDVTYLEQSLQKTWTDDIYEQTNLYNELLELDINDDAIKWRDCKSPIQRKEYITSAFIFHLGFLGQFNDLENWLAALTMPPIIEETEQAYSINLIRYGEIKKSMYYVKKTGLSEKYLIEILSMLSTKKDTHQKDVEIALYGIIQVVGTNLGLIYTLCEGLSYFLDTEEDVLNLLDTWNLSVEKIEQMTEYIAKLKYSNALTTKLTITNRKEILLNALERNGHLLFNAGLQKMAKPYYEHALVLLNDIVLIIEEDYRTAKGRRLKRKIKDNIYKTKDEIKSCREAVDLCEKT